MSTNDVKRITLAVDPIVVDETRAAITSSVAEKGLKLLSLDEEPGRLKTTLVISVSGHPRRVREFQDDWRSVGWADNPDTGIIAGLMIDGAVTGFRHLRRKWQGRHDPPEDEARDASDHVNPDPP